MTLTFHALWMLCALGAVVFAAAARTVRERAAIAAGFVIATVVISPAAVPDATAIGVMAAAAVAVYLFRPRLWLLGVAVGGALAGIFSALLQLQGMPAMLSLPAAAALLIVPIYLSAARPRFAPDVLCDDGLLGVGVLAAAVAVLPGVLDGWHAAANLAATTDREGVASVPLWTMVLLLMSTCLGALYSSWSRR